MRLILCIDDPGYFINIPGIISFRTPIRKDISPSQFNLVISELKKLGIENYTIKSVSEDKPKEKKKIEDIKIKKEEQDLTGIYDRFDKIEKIINKAPKENKSNYDIDEKFKAIENLLKDIIHTKSTQSFGSKPNEIIEKDDGFIPSMDISNIKISGKSTFKTKKVSNDTNEKSNSLAKLIKK